MFLKSTRSIILQLIVFGEVIFPYLCGMENIKKINQPDIKKDDKEIKKLIERLEDAYMIRDWHYVIEIVADLRYKLRNGK